MGRDYIPERDADAVAWLMTFAQRIVSAPHLFHITPEAAQEALAVCTAFADAFRLTSAAGTRTSVTIIRKNESRKAAEKVIRLYAVRIKANPDIDGALKRGLGLRPPRQRRRRIPAPQERPQLRRLSAASWRQELRFLRNPDAGATRIRKPYGAAQLQLYLAIGDVPASGPHQAQFYRAFSANPVQVQFNRADDGKIATYYARWASARGETGPWSQPVTMRIVA